MKRQILALLGGVMLLLASTLNAGAQQKDIQGTIQSQIEAFKADDFATAFTYATPRLQMLFQSPQNFQRMVTQGYPMVWRPADVQFLDLRQESGAMMQIVQITDADGRVHVLDYRMEPGPDGWRIGGVQILKAPGVAA